MAVTEKCVTKILVVQWQSGIMALWYLRPIMKNLRKYVFEKSCYFGGKITKIDEKNRHFW